MDTVIGILPNHKSTDELIADLDAQGYHPEDVSIILKEDVREVQNAHAPTSITEGAVSGAATGSVLGGLAGLLVGIGALAIPGIGALFVAGPLAAALGFTGAAALTVSGAATGAMAGGLVGALTSLGLPEQSAKVYEERIRAGGIAVAVATAESESHHVKNTFKKHGAEEVHTVIVK